jgi:transcriptional regulator of arginine metabolism
MKALRQQKILSIVNENIISEQSAILKKLSEAGFNCTQATLSRDFSELDIKKSRIDGVLRYVKATKSPTVLGAGIKDIRQAENLAVIICEPGTAGAVCVRIDDVFGAEIAGTIAGDDTIFAALESADAAKRFIKKLKNLSE